VEEEEEEEEEEEKKKKWAPLHPETLIKSILVSCWELSWLANC
jgi:hypothetical protein